MKKIFFPLFAAVLAGSLCFAEETPAPSGSGESTASVQVFGDSTAAVSDKVETFTGRIDAVAGGPRPQMTIRGGDGLQALFFIAPDAPIIGKDGNTTTLTWINGNRVSIEYTTSPKGVRTAKSIKVLSDF